MNIENNLNLMILGCGGFIGSHLLDRILADHKGKIIGWDLESRKIERHLDSARLRFVRKDYAQPENEAELRADLGSVDAVINLAAICTPAQYNTSPLKVIRSNFIQSYRLIDLCAEAKKWLIHFSTSEVYGRTLSSYIPGEGYADPGLYELDEDTTPLIMGPINRQRWTYASAKQLLERYVLAHHSESGLDFTIVRPLNFFGPRMDFVPGVDGEGVPRVLACFMEALLKGQPLKLVDGGQARRTILAIEDAIDAVIAILRHGDAARGQIFNIGSRDNETTIADLAHTMRRLYAEISGIALASLPAIVDVTAEAFYGPGYEDCDRRMPRLDRAFRLLGWAPKLDLEESLRRTIAYYWDEYRAKVN